MILDMEQLYAKFEDVDYVRYWAMTNAHGPFVAFIRGWQNYALFKKDQCGNWTWSYEN
jgi:hypothetical protein